MLKYALVSASALILMNGSCSSLEREAKAGEEDLKKGGAKWTCSDPGQKPTEEDPYGRDPVDYAVTLDHDKRIMSVKWETKHEENTYQFAVESGYTFYSGGKKGEPSSVEAYSIELGGSASSATDSSNLELLLMEPGKTQLIMTLLLNMETRTLDCSGG
ncbi:MAG: hypothetical protein AB7T49_16000 [Oligoflexales bacterium]